MTTPDQPQWSAESAIPSDGGATNSMPQGIERSSRSVLWTRLRRSSQIWGFLFILMAFVAFAILPSLFSINEPLSADLGNRLLPPGSASGHTVYWLGTDQLGRDVWSRLVYGTRVSMIIAFSAVVFAGLTGSLLGIIAGTVRGLLGASIMRIADMVLSIPFFLLAILTVAVLGPSLINVVLCLVLVRWPRYARVAYAETLKAQGQDFVRSAVAVGSPPLWIIRKHIVPEVIPSVIVVGTLELGLMVLYEAALSFIGLGVQPPTPSWGSMLSDSQQYIGTAWWLATFPGLALFLLVLSVNMLGDFVRDQLDPSERALKL